MTSSALKSGSTISRELARNGRRIGVWPGGYDAVRADASPHTHIADVIYTHNYTSRKHLDFKTPAEAFCQLQSNVALQT